MRYKYFCCRNPLHVCLDTDGVTIKPDPVKVAAPQPNNLPGVFAYPRCPDCHKTMEFYDSGKFADPLPIAPPPPGELGGAPLSGDISLYSGSGANTGHPNVTWNIIRNAKQMDITIKLMLGKPKAGLWDSVQAFKLSDRLLDTNQVAASPADWWLQAPLKMELWHSFSLVTLLGAANLGTLPATIQIGVQLGNAAWGLIHLLAGHSKAVRNVGNNYIDFNLQGDELNHHEVNIYKTMLLLESGMRRFDTNSITHVYHDSTKNKLVIKGDNSGIIVVTQTNKVMNGFPVYSVTTIYNANSAFGKQIYPRS
jgi:hypothetical protein